MSTSKRTTSRRALSRWLLSAVCALGLAACGSNSSSGSPGSAGSSAGGATDSGAAGAGAAGAGAAGSGAGGSSGSDAGSTIQGKAFADLCHGLQGATVSVVGGNQQAKTDATGAFSLSGVALPVTLQVSGPGLADTRTPELDATSNLEAYAIPKALLSQAYGLAGVTPNPAHGLVAVTFVNDKQLPVGGATISLTDSTGTAVSKPRYLSATVTSVPSVVPSFNAQTTATTPDMGIAIFFDVPPGKYQLKVKRTSYSVPNQTVDVAAGSRTLVRMVGTGTAGTQPARVFGTVQGSPLLPAFGPAAPLGGVKITLHDNDDQTDKVTTSASDGTFSFDVPYTRHEADLTFEDQGRMTERSALFCVASLFTYTAQINDVFWADQQLQTALPAGHVDSSKGHIVESAYAGTIGTSYQKGLTVTVSPKATVYYGPNASTLTTLDPCNAGTCTTQADCPSGTRCDAGVCLVGQAPLCQACSSGGGALCPAGSLPAAFSSGGSNGPCFCAPQVSDCNSNTCGADTVCQSLTTLQPPSASSGTVSLAGPVCFPEFNPATSTLAQPLIVPNLTPGIYTLTASDGRPPARLRISAGIVTGSYWRSAIVF